MTSEVEDELIEVVSVTKGVDAKVREVVSVIAEVEYEAKGGCISDSRGRE